jgi:hypothetical protein
MIPITSVGVALDIDAHKDIPEHYTPGPEGCTLRVFRIGQTATQRKVWVHVYLHRVPSPDELKAVCVFAILHAPDALGISLRVPSAEQIDQVIRTVHQAKLTTAFGFPQRV